MRAARELSPRAAAIVVGVVVACGSALVIWHPLVNGDSLWHLIWGRQLAHGELTTFAPGPTPHPLPVLLGGATWVLGDGGNYVLTYILFGPLALGALCAIAFAVVARLATWWAGLVCVLLLLTSPLLREAAAARYDVVYVALVLGAVALEIAQPRRGVAPLVLLAVAGTLRPEAWLLAGAYWLWLFRGASWRRRAWTAALTAAGPVLWAAVDLAVTGDPLYSLHATDEASALFRIYTPLENLEEAGRNLVGIAGPLTFVPAAAYVWIAIRERLGYTRPLLAVLAITLGSFALLVAFGLASSERYLLLPACVIAVLAAAGLGHRPTARPLFVAVACALVGLQIVGRSDTPAEVRDRRAQYHDYEQQTAELVRRPEVRRLLTSCEEVALPTNRMIATLSYYSGRAPDRFSRYQAGEATPDVFVAPGTQEARELVLTRRRFDEDPTLEVPPGVVSRHRTSDWELFVAPGATCPGPASAGP